MIQKLWVDGCRNLHNQVVKFNRGATYIFGGNNQGKTSILEAIYLCANGVAPFQTDFRCIVSSGKHFGQCAADFNSEHENYRVYVRLSTSQKKDIQVNNQSVRTLRALKKKIHC